MIFDLTFKIFVLKYSFEITNERLLFLLRMLENLIITNIYHCYRRFIEVSKNHPLELLENQSDYGII